MKFSLYLRHFSLIPTRFGERASVSSFGLAR
jgi:hypothetical protein